MAAADWVKQRLPEGASFAKNGAAMSIDEAVSTALADNADDKYYALADLLEVLAANETKQSETMGDYSYSNPRTKELAEYWRGRGASEGAISGSFGFIDAKFQREASDEYEREWEDDDE